MKENLKYEEFLDKLKEKTKKFNKNFASKFWSNYPNSTFFYWVDDDETYNEIAVYTNEETWEIYI